MLVCNNTSLALINGTKSVNKCPPNSSYNIKYPYVRIIIGITEPRTPIKNPSNTKGNLIVLLLAHKGNILSRGDGILLLVLFISKGWSKKDIFVIIHIR